MPPKKKILVIDDDQTILKMVQGILKKYDFETIMAETGQDGLETAKTAKPDAILLDFKMPGLNGYEALKQLKKDPLTTDIPVVILTGNNSISEVGRSLELGASDYIVKPFNNENLVMRIKNVLGD